MARQGPWDNDADKFKDFWLDEVDARHELENLIRTKRPDFPEHYSLNEMVSELLGQDTQMAKGQG